MQQTQPIALFHELVAINRRVMAENCNRLQWGMVACWVESATQSATQFYFNTKRETEVLPPPFDVGP